MTTSTRSKLDALLKEYESQFVKDEMCIGTTPLTSMMIDMGGSDPVSQKHCYEEISMGERRNRKVICSQSHLQQ